MKKFLLIIMLAVLIAGGLTGLWWHRRNADKELWATGTIEATKVEMSAKVTGRILSRPVKEGDVVKAGDLIARLDSLEQEATVKAFQAQVTQAGANLEAAKADYERAAKDWERAQRLLHDGALSAQETDSSKNAYLSTQGRLNAARADVQRAQAALINAEQTLANYTIYSPLGGRVLTKNLEAGEMAQPGLSIVTLVDIQNPWVRVYVPEEDMGKVKYQGQAMVYVDAFPKREFAGTITEISEQAEFTPKNIQTKKERVNLVFGVKVAIENKEELLKPGMPADVKFSQ
jgi:HlyD family secretion protein